MSTNWRNIISLAFPFALLLLAAQPLRQAEPLRLQYPEYWPKPAYNFDKNPLSQAGVDLGRKLFYDPVLSRDNTISCSSCHLSYTAFTHVDHARSHGIDDRVGRRNSPVLINLAWSKFFMWDGAVNHLDVQALAPISHPDEMGEDIGHVIQKLQRLPPYPAMFFAAFGDSTVTGERLLKALSQFELTLISAGSKYDQVMQRLDTFTAQEQNGYRLFQKNCARCHTEPFFTHQGFESNGLPLDTALLDVGRMALTKQSVDSMKFKVPTLRNIEYSYPYMHDGRFGKLSEVINHYTRTNTLGQRIELSPDEKVDLKVFLLSLSDRAFLFNPKFGYPRN